MAFEQLEAEMTVLRENELTSILGGTGTAQDVLDYMLANNIDYMSSGGVDEWWSNNSSNFGGSVSSNESGLWGTNGSSNGGSGYGGSGYGGSGYGGSGYGGGNSGVPVSHAMFSLKTEGGFSMISIDGGSTYQYTYMGPTIVAHPGHADYGLESAAYYNPANDTMNFQITTLSDWNADMIGAGTVSAIGSAYGTLTGTAAGIDPAIAWINSIAFTDQSHVRASINDLFGKLVVNKTGAQLIPHASGSTTVQISNWSNGISGVQMMLEDANSAIFNELKDKGILHLNSIGSGYVIDDGAYNSYRDNGGFDTFMQNYQGGGQ